MQDTPRSTPAGGAEVTLTFGVLGPVEATYAGAAIPLGGAKQRGLLAALLLRDNDVVPVTRLVEDLWGVDSPPTAPKMVQVFLSRLRAALTTAGAPAGSIETHPQGYALRVGPEQVDLRRAEALVRDGAALSDRPEEAASRLAQALAQWRGTPLAGLESLPFAQSAVPRLEEFRLATIGARIGADLAAGRHAGLIGELRQLTVDHPLREQPQAQLMLALYRSGRQVEALEVFTSYRSRLRDEVALDPSQELRRLEHSMLTHDAGLLLPEPVGAVELVASTPELTGTPPPRHRRPLRARWVAAVAAVIVTAVAAGVVGLTARGGHHPRAGTVAIVPNSVAVIDAATNAVAADVPVGHDPGAVAVLDGSAWVADRGDQTITRVAVPAYRVRETYGLSARPVSVTAAEDRVWIGLGFEGTLSRILPEYDQISAPFAPAVGESGLLAVAADGDDLWVGLSDGSLLELDPGSLRLRERVPLSRHVGSVAAAGRQVWTTLLGSGDLYQIDPARRQVARTVDLPGTAVGAALGDGDVWVASTLPNRLWRISESTGRVVSSTALAAAPSGLAVGGDDVWVAEGGSGDVLHVDASGARLPSSIAVGHSVGDLAISGATLLVTIDGD